MLWLRGCCGPGPQTTLPGRREEDMGSAVLGWTSLPALTGMGIPVRVCGVNPPPNYFQATEMMSCILELEGGAWFHAMIWLVSLLPRAERYK